jgi:TPR repeat protein
LKHERETSDTLPRAHADEIYQIATPIPDNSQSQADDNAGTPTEGSISAEEGQIEMQPQFQYLHEDKNTRRSRNDYLQPSASFNVHHGNHSVPELRIATDSNGRPESTFTTDSGSDANSRPHKRHLSTGATPSPSASPINYAAGVSNNRQSPDMRPTSYIDLLHVPYPQQVAPVPSLDNSMLRSVVGSNASLLDTRKTLEMYRANVKKTNEPAIQYEFALFMVQAARESTSKTEHQEMLQEAKQILQKLADRSYPFAQYYLGDGLASGVFNKGKEDYDRAFPLFVAASKHGHAEAGYRAALCYEFGWGCRRDYAKAVQFYRASASKNHPGAATRLGLACLEGTMGLNGKYREGVKWLKRAAESADFQYNSAPYELARLHEVGYGDDIFKDEAYAAQLYTQSAELSHPEASLVMGRAYEYGLLTCPKDAALSIHFYNSAAQAGQPEAMMALCAWYLFGAEPILARDDQEAFEWAKRSADLGKPI